ncbi:immunoglobulin-like domain-containing protein [Paenibacillus sp. Soil724D2]|uniref:immunoglobulin-like domain-containing protein n=1 Tax=Paenibacillus sp. (strain Soil724D2) TaxID=1736392 RepID=UPI000712DDE4|nr:immunoglobulin-like domain-containing protein [Paenibacillus sp. Soil724D2]KRE48459.1 hypothetical protein ASG85_05510 [Paenibacillus sp. Soil724D2]
MKKKLLGSLYALLFTVLMLSLLPDLPVHAVPGDLVNVALANNLTVKFSKENPPSETAEKLFDNNSNTKWLGPQTTNVWVQIQFKYGDKQAVKKYAMVSANDAPTRDPRNWRVEGSNDGVNWNVLDEQSNQTFSARFQTKEYKIADDKVKEYAYYRLFILNNNGESTNTQLADWKLFDVELDDNDSLALAVTALELGDTSALTKGVVLPTTFIKGTTVTWASSNPSVISHKGKLVKRPELGQPNASLTITATVQKGSLTQTKPFIVKVLAISEVDSQYESGIDFDSGFESGDPAPTDTNGPDDTYRLLSMTQHIGEFCCAIGGMESKKGTGAHNGAGALQFSGNALNADQSYAYNQIFDAEIAVKPSTTLSYWVFPEKESDVIPSLVRTTSKYVALDVLFTDGTYLHDLGAKDQYGVTIHPNAQGKGGFVVEDQWNLITANIGQAANGKIIDKILFGFDSSGTVAGYFRGTVDDITINHDSSIGENNTQAVNTAKAALSLGDTSAVRTDLSLPTAGEQQTTIIWESLNPLVLSDAGQLAARPLRGDPSAEVKLTATIRKGDSIAMKEFLVYVLPMSDAESVAWDQTALQLGETSAVADDLGLIATGKYKSSITWASSKPTVIDETGDVTRPNAGIADAVVTLTATITSGSAVATKSFTVTVVAQGDKGDVTADLVELELHNITTVTKSVYLPDSSRFGSKITWESSNPAVFSETGLVHRPGVGQPDAEVMLTATLTKGIESAARTFTIIVKAMSADEEKAILAAEALVLGNTNAVVSNLNLPISVTGLPDVVITWASSDPEVIDFHGRVVQPCFDQPHVTVALTATISSGATSMTKTFIVTVLALGESEEPVSDNANLSGIRVNGNPIAGFDKDVVSYTVVLPEGTTQAPVTAATVADSSADVKITQAANLPGSAVIVVTAEDGVTKKTYSLDFAVNGAPISYKVTLQGADHVMRGILFDLTYDLRSANPNIFAQDLTITYDPAAVEFISAKSLVDGFQVVDKKETSGQVRILAANIGTNRVTTASGLLTLQWKVKPVTAAATTAITLSKVVISDGDGVETDVEGASHRIQITVVDKAALIALIATAQSTHDAALEGSGNGQYPVGSKLTFQSAIHTAKGVADQVQSTQVQVDQAAAELLVALQTFRTSMITQLPGDSNGDNRFSIGDLAIMASYYGKTSEDPNWQLYKKADLTNDGIIDIADLAFSARLILSL